MKLTNIFIVNLSLLAFISSLLVIVPANAKPSEEAIQKKVARQNAYNAKRQEAQAKRQAKKQAIFNKKQQRLKKKNKK